MAISIKVSIINSLTSLTFSLAIDVTMVVQLIEVSTSHQDFIGAEYTHKFVDIPGITKDKTDHILYGTSKSLKRLK